MEEMSCRWWWHLYCTHMALSVPLLWVTCLCHRRWIVTTCLPPSLALFKSSLLWTCVASHLIVKSIATQSLSKRAYFCCIALNWVSSRLYCASGLSIFMHVDHPTTIIRAMKPPMNDDTKFVQYTHNSSASWKFHPFLRDIYGYFIHKTQWRIVEN